MRIKFLTSIISCSLGNILEWYDFGLFTIFSTLFGRLFFPTENPKVALIATFGIFAIGFLCRPIGALLFGYLGDIRGRAITLRLSMLVIALPTLLIGILPTYAQIGILAPILLTLIRMIQGISIGGEYSGNLIYLAESAPTDYRATLTSCASMGANTGILLASLVGIITNSMLSIETLETIGWRIPYLISGIFCLFIFAYRLNITETPVFTALKQRHALSHNPLRIVFTQNLPELFRTIGMVCFGSTFYYFCFVYLPTYLISLQQLTLSTISYLITLLILVMILLAPVCGFICDKIGRRKMLLFNSLLATLAIIPGFYLLHFNIPALTIAVLVLFTLISSLEQGTTPISVVENFPATARYTGLSFGYNVGNGLLGGTVAMVCTSLLAVTQIIIMPAVYVAICASITFLVVYFFVPETRGKSLAATTN